ncbi:MAG TPA: adenylate/guanylate cyclase domain-containing protein [Solimonas sp.]|nr:adenylate/guanylate cyclase domain-containing protein [Solimonas sp.]
MSAPQTRYAKNGKTWIAYQVIGQGPIDLVYSGGLVTHVDLMWDMPEIERFLERMAAFARLIVFDFRGVGLSDPVPLDRLPSFEDWVEDLRCVLDAAESKQAAIFAERDAGGIAMLFAATYPERTRALILANSCAKFGITRDYPCGEESGAGDTIHNMILEHWGTEKFMQMAVPSRAGDTNFLRMAARFQRAAATPHVAAEQYHHVMTRDVRPALPGIACRTLILHRARYPFLNAPGHARYLEQHIKGSKRIELPGADALFAFDRADEVLGHVEELLTGERTQSVADRVLKTIFFADIVGSTRLAAELGDGAWRDLVAHFQAVVRKQLTRFRGREVDAAGDGFFAVFDSPTAALRCARAIRDEAQAMKLAMRVGLHTGECEIDGDAVRGLSVHIGARVMAEAESGEIWVSGTVRELVAGSGFEFARRGEHKLKGVFGRWRLYALSDEAEVREAE